VTELMNTDQQESWLEYKKIRMQTGKLPENPVAAYGGTSGSYSEDAAIGCFGKSGERIACREFEDVFKSVLAGTADCGVIPVENSTTGAVRDIAELLLRYSCSICGETEVNVHHCLLGIPGAALSDISRVTSHEQSLYQCREYLDNHPDWTLVPCVNNAYAARDTAERGELSQAAIASRRAGEIYGLNILADGINTSGVNATRFLIISQGTATADENCPRKVSLSFGIRHCPGALYRVLGIFERHGLNLCRIESRPSGKSNWEYIFFVDFSGTFPDSVLDKAVEELILETTGFRFLGCYPERTES
jgi:chorismate mutase/prephenate dehydratase